MNKNEYSNILYRLSLLERKINKLELNSASQSTIIQNQHSFISILKSDFDSSLAFNKSISHDIPSSTVKKVYHFHKYYNHPSIAHIPAFTPPPPTPVHLPISSLIVSAPISTYTAPVTHSSHLTDSSKHISKANLMDELKLTLLSKFGSPGQSSHTNSSSTTHDHTPSRRSTIHSLPLTDSKHISKANLMDELKLKLLSKFGKPSN